MYRPLYPSNVPPGQFVPAKTLDYNVRTSDESSTSSNSSGGENRNGNIVPTQNNQKTPWRPNRKPAYRPRVYPHNGRKVAPMTDNPTAHQNPYPRNEHQQPQQQPVYIPPASQFAALDCEMVGIGPGGYTSSAARVTIVDWNGQILMDEYIQQSHPVTDYRTFVSGITPEHLHNATMSLDKCRVQVLGLLQNRILVGHALKNDLEVLGITHPWWLIRDTAKYEPFMQLHYHTGVLCPRKLKHLVHEKLHREIQAPGRPHSPYEDARAALDLYRLVRPQWESLMKYEVDRVVSNQQQRRLASSAQYNYVLVQ